MDESGPDYPFYEGVYMKESALALKVGAFCYQFSHEREEEEE